MADYNVLLRPPAKDESPYTIVQIEGLAGNKTVKVRAQMINNVPGIWTLNSIWSRLVADGTVANRYPVFYQYYGTAFPALGFGGEAVTASQTKDFYALQGVDLNSNGVWKGSHVLGIQPEMIVIQGGMFLYGSVTAGVAGDTWTIRMMFKYMNRILNVKDPYQDYVK